MASRSCSLWTWVRPSKAKVSDVHRFHLEPQTRSHNCVCLFVLYHQSSSPWPVLPGYDAVGKETVTAHVTAKRLCVFTFAQSERGREKKEKWEISSEAGDPTCWFDWRTEKQTHTHGHTNSAMKHTNARVYSELDGFISWPSCLHSTSGPSWNNIQMLVMISTLIHPQLWPDIVPPPRCALLTWVEETVRKDW